MDVVGGHELVVGGLAGTTGDQVLQEAFSKFGEISELKIIKNRESGGSRGFGFVKFKDEQAMRDAIEAMHGQDLDGRTITVSEAKSRGSGGGVGGYRGGGGRDGGGYSGGGGGYGGRGSGSGYGGGSGGYGGGRGGGSDASWARARITIDGLFRV